MCVYIDDILVTGTSEQEHFQTLDEVLTRLGEAGLKLKRSKCFFLQMSVEYLGHNISAEGLRPTQEKVRALTEAPSPNNQCFPTAVFWVGKLLWEVFTQSFQHSSPSPLITPEEDHLDPNSRKLSWKPNHS